MSNRLQLRRTTTSGAPLLASLLTAEMAINLTDNDVYYSNGTSVIQLNAAANIRTDANHRFVTDADITSWNTPYTLPVADATTLGGVKIGSNINVDLDGTIHLGIASSTVTGLLSSTDWSTFNGKQDALGYVPVNQAGDTMMGALVLAGAPTAANEAATKSYVDAGDLLNLPLTGGTMSGALILNGAPVVGLGAATKDYVDSAVSDISGSYAPPVQTLVDLSALVPAGLEDKQMRLVEDSGAIYRFDTSSTDTPDGVDVIVPDTLPATGRWIKVQAATQNHNALNGLQGGALNDYLHLTTAEKNGYDGHLADGVIHLTPTQSTWLGNINASSAEVNYLVGVTSAIQTQLDGKQSDLGYVPVNKAGDTMLGDLVLASDPSSAMMPVTLQYLQSYVIDGGTF